MRKRLRELSSLRPGIAWRLCFPVAMGMLFAACGGGMDTPARHLISLTVDPADAEAVAPSGTAPFDAIGTFDREPKTVASLTAQWTSSDTAVASIDSTGLVTCQMIGGPVTLTATVASDGKTFTATGTITCTAAPPPPTGTGNCVYICPSTRCGELTGYCAGERDGACHLTFSSACPVGKPATASGQNSCAEAVDVGRSCTP